MKKIIQIFLILFIFVAIFFFYDFYFREDQKIDINIVKQDNSLNLPKKNNLIKNLQYEVVFDRGITYLIRSKFSELIYLDGNEIVDMNDVNAEIIERENNSFKIKSDHANYNNSNYTTIFTKNVYIEYMGNMIFSDELSLDIKNNLVLVSGNVKYISEVGSGTTDNIKINLITKKIDIYVNNSTNKVKIKKN